MPLFGRKKQPVEEEPLVETESGWKLLQEVVNTYWTGLAATAWRGYQQSGRGAVVARFASFEFGFSPADVIRGDPTAQDDLSREVLSLCQSYNPKKEIVLVTTVTRVRGEDRRLSDLVEVLKPPRGVMSPPEAAAYMQHVEKQHQLYTAMRARSGNLDAEDDERHEKGLDPDEV